jgi:Fe-S cluster biogenesis protein NfuA
MAEDKRLDDTAIGLRLARCDELLERLEGVPGRTSEAAIEAVQTLTELYGEALSRVLDTVDAQTAEHLAGDELLTHLLVLHGIHPEPVEDRITGALDRLRPALQERGAGAELAGVEEGVASVRLTAKGCGPSSAEAVEELVREALLAVAPELTGVRRAPAQERDPAFVPLESLTLRPVGAGGRT